MYSINQSYIQCFAFVFNKLNLYSVFCICIQKTKITFNDLHKHSLHQTYIQWTREICIDVKNWLLFVFIVSLVCISIQYTLVHLIRWKKPSPVHLSWLRVRINWYDNLQILFLRYTKVYETSLWWRTCLKRCVHLGHQMSSNFTVKWVWIFFACQQESPFHGFANSSLIIRDLMLWPDSPNPSTACNFGHWIQMQSIEDKFGLLNTNAKH